MWETLQPHSQMDAEAFGEHLSLILLHGKIHLLQYFGGIVSGLAVTSRLGKYNKRS